MTIFLAGGTGVVGRRLIPLLLRNGHRVAATTRTSAKASELRQAGAQPFVIDGLDRDAVVNAVVTARPDVVVHQTTALARMRNLRRFDREFEQTNRLRTEGLDILVEAAQRAGATRFIAQSYTGWPNAREGGPVKTETDPLDPNPVPSMRRTLDAIRHVERRVPDLAGMVGVVLRYGFIYGPGTAPAPGAGLVDLVRKRMFPLAGDASGVWSFIHVNDVAAATLAAIEGAPAGIFNVVDDEPAEVSIWLPDLARVIGAPPPRRVPTWLARLLIGEAGVSMMTQIRGASNAKAKRVLGWQPVYASWRQGFRSGLSEGSPV